MRFLKNNKTKIIFIAVILIALALAFSFGGNNVSEKKAEKEKVVQSMPLDTKINEEPVMEESEPDSEIKEESTNTVTEEKEQQKDKKTEVAPQQTVNNEDVIQTTEKSDVSKPEKVESKKLKGFSKEDEKPLQAEKEETVTDNPLPDKTDKKELGCTITIRCDTLLENLDMLEEAKWVLVPKDGVILAEKKAVFYEGESVFDVLLRETRLNSIHMEYVDTPMYDSAYIEGIHNLYEFDCGELSGWIYRVNGWKPNYGCSLYTLKDGDRIEWLYTCELGKDL